MTGPYESLADFDGQDSIPLQGKRDIPFTSGFQNCASEIKLSDLVNDHGKFFGSNPEFDKIDSFGENPVMKLVDVILGVNTGYRVEGDEWKKSVLRPLRETGAFDEVSEMESPFFNY